MNTKIRMKEDMGCRVKNQPAERTLTKRMKAVLCETGGMELVQVAILVALAIGLGLIFKERIVEFVTSTFDSLMSAEF